MRPSSAIGPNGEKLVVHRRYYVTRNNHDELDIEHCSFFEAVCFASDWLQRHDGRVSVSSIETRTDIKKFQCSLSREEFDEEPETLEAIKTVQLFNSCARERL